MKPQCEAIAAEYAWWSQQCPNDAVGIVEVDGDEYWACGGHGGVS